MAAVALDASAQADRHDVRSGNRKFRKGNWKEAEIEYRKALVKDSASIAANYNLAGALYRQENFTEAGKALDTISKTVVLTPHAPSAFYNKGNVACQEKDWQAAVDAYKKSLLLNPGDLEAKENYAYAKMMLDNQKGGGGGGNENQQNRQNQQNQDQNKDQNQNQQDQGQDQQDNQNQQDNQDNQDGQDQQDQGKISPQQAQQMLRAIQAREKNTQDKVNREKAEALKSRQKEKNW